MTVVAGLPRSSHAVVVAPFAEVMDGRHHREISAVAVRATRQLAVHARQVSWGIEPSETRSILFGAVIEGSHGTVAA